MLDVEANSMQYNLFVTLAVNNLMDAKVSFTGRSSQPTEPQTLNKQSC